MARLVERQLRPSGCDRACIRSCRRAFRPYACRPPRIITVHPRRLGVDDDILAVTRRRRNASEDQQFVEDHGRPTGGGHPGEPPRAPSPGMGYDAGRKRGRRWRGYAHTSARERRAAAGTCDAGTQPTILAKASSTFETTCRKTTLSSWSSSPLHTRVRSRLWLELALLDDENADCRREIARAALAAPGGL